MKDKIKIDEARFIVGDYEIGKRKMKWDIPWNLIKLNKRDKYRTIIGIGRFKGTKKDVYVALSRGNEIVYLGKLAFLKIAESLKKL